MGLATKVGMLAAAAVLSGCAAGERTDDVTSAATGESTRSRLGARYGISVTLPSGWHGRLGRGVVYASSAPLATVGSWREVTENLAADDVALAIYENGSQRSPTLETSDYPPLTEPLRLGASDFESFDGVTDDSRTSGHGYARQLFAVSGRFFVLFAESGRPTPSAGRLASLNALLGSLEVRPGDFFPGLVAPARFRHRTGWFVGASESAEANPDGEFTTAWAATVPYLDEWNALPPQATLRRLPREGIVIWVGLSRSNRFPPDTNGFAPLEPPLRLAGFDERRSWEGQVRDLPEHVLQGSFRGQYQVDVRVFFGRPDPTQAMRAEAQRMLDQLVLPEWGPWETG